MKKHIVTLSEGWEFGWKQFVSTERGPLTKEESDGLTWYPATVPGNAQDELCSLGLIEDPFYADNADHYRWCEEVDFWYRRRITAPAANDADRIVLECGGLDTFATLWIDGRKIGSHDNMFIPFSVDITAYLSKGHESGLLVRFAAPAFESGSSERDPVDHPPPQRIRTRRAQITYGWDIGPRLLATGPWRPVTLSVVKGGRILHAGARTLSANDASAELEMVATVDWYGSPRQAHIAFSWESGKADTTLLLSGGENDVVVPVAIPQPELWWPNGIGEQKLHDLSVTLTSADGTELDSVAAHFGICNTALVEQPRRDGALGFRFTVNGQDYFAKGMNWTPNEVFFGKITPERTESLVGMAAEANINMLRVWGGGIYEDKAFWDACDRHGILVWQDFMFSCSLYPQDRPFLNNVTAEAESVVRAMRGRVSLAAWCGDNEIDMICGVENGTLISREVLKSVVTRLDGNRPYIVSSPFSEPGRPPNDPESGDCHLWNHTVRHDDPFYTGFSANFVSEMGRISFPDRVTIESFMPQDKRWPPTHPLWYYHSSDTNRWGRYRNVGSVLDVVRNNGHEDPKSLEELIEVTQKIQADAYRYWIEHFGGNPQCWGLLLWNLCDIWPQMSDAVISYDLRPKKAYSAVRDAYGALSR